MRGLDPRIHQKMKSRFKMMDCRALAPLMAALARQ